MTCHWVVFRLVWAFGVNCSFKPGLLACALLTSHLCVSSCGLWGGNSWCKLFYSLHSRTCGSASSWCRASLDQRAPSPSPTWETGKRSEWGRPQIEFHCWKLHFNTSSYIVFLKPAHLIQESSTPKSCGKLQIFKCKYFLHENKLQRL